MTYNNNSRAPLKETEAIDIVSLDQDINIDFEECCLHHENIILEVYQRPDKSYLQEPSVLPRQVGRGKLVQKALSKQADLDKVLKQYRGKFSRKHRYLLL